jgi:hypothetical protein
MEIAGPGCRVCFREGEGSSGTLQRRQHKYVKTHGKPHGTARLRQRFAAATMSKMQEQNSEMIP